MSVRLPLACALALASVPDLARAHPHVFVDVAMTVVVAPDGTLDGIEVTWTYDDFYSLLLLADLGLDMDGDGALEPAELARLDGFDLQWVAGFEGDSYVSRNGAPVALGAPEGRGTSVTDGLITTTHFRAASGSADGVVLKAYDPTFYTAYTLQTPVRVTGPCVASVAPADLDRAYTMVEELLYATPTADVEIAFPKVGEAFADTVTLLCGG